MCNYMQKLKGLNRKNFFDVLKELINYIENDKKKIYQNIGSI